MLSPVARLGDAIGSVWTRRNLEAAEPAKRMSIDDAPSDAEFAAAIIELSQPVGFRPGMVASGISWFLAHAARKERYGPMHRAIVHDGKGGLVGCYIYHGGRGGTGRALQVLARKGKRD